MKFSRLLILSVALFCVHTVSAQRIGMAYWDADHLYDTLPSPFYDDSDYLPCGALKWDTERYLRKVEQTAAVIDSLALPIVALWGVENEDVVRDIAARCHGDYTYLHRSLNTLDGMDFALLYYGDVFLPTMVEPGNRNLYIEGLLYRRKPASALRRGGRRGVVRTRTDTLSILLSADRHAALPLLDDIRAERPTFRLLVMGNYDPKSLARYGLRLQNPAPEGEKAAAPYGNTTTRSGWKTSDIIAADTTFHILKNEVYLREFMIDSQSGHPLPTFNKKEYVGGYSRALPVYIYVE